MKAVNNRNPLSSKESATIDNLNNLLMLIFLLNVIYLYNLKI